LAHRSPTTPWRAVVVGVLLLAVACGQAHPAFAFETLDRAPVEQRPHLAAYACALAGAGLVAASFPLTQAADRRYAEYQRETDPARIESRWDRTVRADHYASGALLAGETLLVAGAYLRFLRHPAPARVSLSMGPGACAIRWSF
jgi:hypothetical protein